jgi:hypothetical protein
MRLALGAAAVRMGRADQLHTRIHPLVDACKSVRPICPQLLQPGRELVLNQMQENILASVALCRSCCVTETGEEVQLGTVRM